LTLKYLALCKEEREKVKENKKGVFVIQDLDAIQSEIIKGQNQIPKEFKFKRNTGIVNIKSSLYSTTMNATGILGYYNPFTSESQYNSNLPNTYIPSTIAHETSHQLGFAREQEASFIGYLVGKNSNNPEIRYSIDYFVLKSLLSVLIQKNPKFVENIISEYSPGMKRDQDYENQFILEHENFLTTVFNFTNNLFLKANQQDGNITYSYFIDLLVRYERENKD